MKQIDKFSIAEAVSNESGKTSGTKTLGMYYGIISGLCVIAGVVAYFIKGSLDLFNSSLLFTGTSAGLMYGSKWVSSKFADNQNESTKETTNEV